MTGVAEYLRQSEDAGRAEVSIWNKVIVERATLSASPFLIFAPQIFSGVRGARKGPQTEGADSPLLFAERSEAPDTLLVA